MDAGELKAGKEIDALIAEKVMGWEKFNVEYFSTPGCSKRQIELRDWMDRVGLDSVGTYYIDVQRNFWIEVQNWRPSSDIADAMGIDRPEWQWDFIEDKHGLRVYIWHKDGNQTCDYNQPLVYVKVSWSETESRAAAYCLVISRAALKAVMNDDPPTPL